MFRLLIFHLLNVKAQWKLPCQQVLLWHVPQPINIRLKWGREKNSGDDFISSFHFIFHYIILMKKERINGNNNEKKKSVRSFHPHFHIITKWKWAYNVTVCYFPIFVVSLASAFVCLFPRSFFFYFVIVIRCIKEYIVIMSYHFEHFNYVCKEIIHNKF